MEQLTFFILSFKIRSYELHSLCLQLYESKEGTNVLSQTKYQCSNTACNTGVAEPGQTHQRLKALLLSSCVLVNSRSVSLYCRYMLGLSIVPAVVQFVGFLFLPESPRWLLQNGRSQEARQVLSRIRGGQNIDTEFETIRTSIEEEEKEAGGGKRFQMKINNTDNNKDKTPLFEQNEGF